MYTHLSTDILPILIPPNSRILAAVSGGPDSVAMAHVLYRYIKENNKQNLSLLISHVNHGVRKESTEEAELVRMLAEKIKAKFILHEFDAKEYASKCKKGFQEAAREWRYARWQEDMEEFGCSLLATAHHLGDQAETVLYRLIRGSGAAGLAGIYPAKDRIIRPLLTISKKDIIEYCHREGLSYAVDKSNYEPYYDRNKIRLELLPELEKVYNEKIQEALGRTAELLRWDEEYIGSQVDKAWAKYCLHIEQKKVVISYGAWREPEAVLSRLLRRAASIINGEPRGLEYKYIKLLMGQGTKIGWKQDLPSIKVEAAKKGFFFLPGALEQSKQNYSEIEEQILDWEIPLIIDKWHELPALGLKVGMFTKLNQDSSILWWTEFDKNKLLDLKNPLICRMRRPGDRMYYVNLGHKNIKKVFQDNGIPKNQRERLPFFVCGETVLWIPGVSMSDSYRPANELSPKLYGIVADIRPNI